MQQKFPKEPKSAAMQHYELRESDMERDVEASAYDRLRELEDLFQRSEERFRVLAKAIAQITWTAAPDGQVVEDIPFWRAYTGQSEAEVKGLGWLEAVHPDDNAHVLATWQQAIATKTMYEKEYRIRRADNVYRYFLVRGIPIFVEEDVLSEWVGICTDITERKLLEEQVVARASQLEAIFETITDGLIVYDGEGNIIETNVITRDVLNKDYNYYNKNFSERLKNSVLRDENDQPLSIDRMPLMRLLHGEELTGNNTVDVLTRSPKGEKIQINIGGAPMRDKEGQIVGAVSIFRDVTERRRFETEHMRLSEVLQETNAHLEQVNKVQSDFISIVSHEFRTTLTGIQGFSELLRDCVSNIEEVKDYAIDINTDAQRLNRMITELLDLERMKSGKMVFYPVSFNLNTLLIELIEHIRPTVLDHSIHFNLDEHLPQVIGDRDKITQVVTNLLSNAIKYSPDGGAILVTSWSEENFVHVSIQDSGMGIPEPALEKIFTAYHRVNSEQTRYIQGTGLGLSIVLQIIQMHGGKVWAESKSGQGSTFHFTLPL